MLSYWKWTWKESYKDIYKTRLAYKVKVLNWSSR